jgi:UDP:flavonoid glycosyltransferase YjiC (YdhE family)
MTYDRNELLRIVERALALSGQRAVLLAGWGGLRPSELPANMCVVEWAPLNWLFSRMAAVVHHGGAGTTAESLRAGVPTVVVPFFHDQFFWSRRVFALGAGPRPIARKDLTAQKLAEAIRSAVTDSDMRRNAEAVAKRIRTEDGVARAVDAFERHMSAPGGKRAGRPWADGQAKLVDAGATPARLTPL